ncbi:uncharacterized protein LOC133181613 [Saccostrea echinata]|uniref:uncharacterized protein LOC133181613 n=1 Tax=Saccostrea echinata TaxID=191078 RepID=UPI002A8229D7|nr:uncharacterized protein LOC133181613 [Saccostrea echinata]
MANASLTKVNEQYWASVQGKVKDWIQKTDATVLVLYIPQPTKRNPIPTLKFEGSRKLKAVVESEEVRIAISTACSGPPPPVKSIKDEMENIIIQPWTMQVKRCIISNLVRQYMELKYGRKRDIWGYPSLKPEWWPDDIEYISPNERRTVDKPLSNISMDQILDSYVEWKNSNGSRRKDFEEGSGEVLEEVSGNEEVMPSVSVETPGMNSSLPISPTLSVGGFFSGGTGSIETEMERTHEPGNQLISEEVSGSEEVMPSVSNEKPGMNSSLPTSPTLSVGEGFFSGGTESKENEACQMEMEVEEMGLPERTDMDETAMPDGNINDMGSTENTNVQSLLKVGWDDVVLTKYIYKIWSKQRNDSVEPFLLSKTCGVSINNRSLISAKSLITDEIIDAYLGIICGLSNNFFYVPCSVISMIFHPRHQNEVSDVLNENKGKVLLAIVNRREIHWILLVIDQRNKSLLIIDPMGETKTTCQLIFKLWINYLTQRGHDAEGWKIDTIHHSKQQDSVSCGVYCMKFAEGIVLNTSLHLTTQKDTVQEIRCNIMKTIINNQDEDTKNFCRRCFRHEPPNSKVKRIKWVQCDGCAISWYHTVCLNLKQVRESTFVLCDVCKMSE